MLIDIDDTKKVIFEEIMNNPDKNFFIQGGAGTGKSTLINYIRKHLGRKHAVVAPTGIAADLINGVTIHSLFKLGGRPYFPLNLVEKYKNYDDIVELIDTLIIDEVSMLRADILDTINILCQKAKKNSQIFGGIQLILVGDLYQLPPVYRYDIHHYDNKQIKKEKIDARDYMNETYGCLQPFFFDALCYQEADFQKRELTTCYRQNDAEFLKNLNIIRENNNKSIDDALDYFNNCDENDINVPIVTSTRSLAKKKNDEEFEKIQTEEKIFKGKFEGDYYTNGNEKILQQRKSDVQVPEFLHLKKTAKVMICKNDPDGEYVNGTIGEIVDFGKISEDGVGVDVIRVKIQNTKHLVDIKKATWQIQEYVKNNKNELELKNIGSYTQFPIKLAYAITIHKSQGQTWDAICIDLGNNAAFADGQVYVALSRVKTKEGIHLKRKLLASDVRVNPRIEEFLKTGKRPAPLTDELICTPENAADALTFWKKYFSEIHDNNFNYASKGTNSNHRQSFWATLPNSRLENDWYMVCTDKKNKISKLFFIPASALNRDQFGIDLTIQRKYGSIPDADEKFEICLIDNNEDNYLEQINEEVCFGNFLYAVAEYKNNQVKIDKLNNNNDDVSTFEEDDMDLEKSQEIDVAKVISDVDDINTSKKLANNKNAATSNKKEHFSASKVETDVKKLKNAIYKEFEKLQNKYGIIEETNEQDETIKRLKIQNKELKKRVI